MRLRSAALLSASLALPFSLAAALGFPQVDLSNAKVSGTTSVAIWSSTDAPIASGSWFTVSFPPGTTVPNPVLGACECLAMKYSVTTTALAKSFSDTEVLITSGNSGNGVVNFQIPKPIDKGKFYFRFRSTYGIVNPTQAGFATLSLTGPEGVTLSSRGYYISVSTSSDVSLAQISGQVTYSGSSKAAGAVLVLASTDGSGAHPLSMAGPSAANALPRGVTSRAHTAATGTDGRYRMLVPAGTYTLTAFAGRVTKTATAFTYQSVSTTSGTSVNAVAGTPATANLTLPAFP